MVKKIIFLLMTAIINSQVIAQDTSEKSELEKEVELLRIAMVEGNKAGLENASSDQLTYGHSGGLIENKSEFVEKIVSGKSDFVSIDLSNQTISVSENTAVVRHDLSAVTNDNGTPGTVDLHVLSVWQKQNGKWKMLARQAVKLKP